MLPTKAVVFDKIQSPTNQIVQPITPAQHYLQQATSANTRKAYQAAVRAFENWGGQLPATSGMIVRYLVEKAAYLNPRSLALHLTALSHWHRYQNLPDPTSQPAVRKILVGIHRTHGKPAKKAPAFTLTHLQSLIAALDSSEDSKQSSTPTNTLQVARDRALLLLGYFGAFRRSELLALQVEHLQFTEDGLLILLPRSKTDTTGEGLTKALPKANVAHLTLCPARAVQHWLDMTKLTEGPLFRSITRWGHLQPKALHLNSLNDIIHRLTTHAGLDEKISFSSHSLRRGFATSAARAGASFTAIKRQGGWRNDSVVRGYIEEGQCFEDNAAGTLLK